MEKGVEPIRLPTRYRRLRVKAKVLTRSVTGSSTHEVLKQRVIEGHLALCHCFGNVLLGSHIPLGIRRTSTRSFILRVLSTSIAGVVSPHLSTFLASVT